MPTTVTKIVDPSNQGGTDYTSLSAWEAGRQADIVAGDRIEVAECRTSSSTVDTTACTINGWTTDATRYAVIQSTGANKHAGVWDSTKYNLSNAAATALTSIQPFTRVNGIQITANGQFAFVVSGACNGTRIFNCILRRTDAVGSPVINQNAGASTTCYFYNNLILAGTAASSRGIDFNQTTTRTSYVENNTFVGNGTTTDCLTVVSTATVIARNNLCSGFSNTTTYSGTFAAGTDNNTTSSSDAIGTGSNNSVSQTFTFTNAAGGDYSLASGDTGARNKGTTLAGISAGFTDDIIGYARDASGAIDCGCFECPAVPAYSPPPFHRPMRFFQRAG